MEACGDQILAESKLPGHTHGVMESELRLIGLMSVYRAWMRKQV